MAADPIHELRSRIHEASTIPTAEPFVPSSAPLDRLLATIEDARNGRETPSANENRAVSTGQPAAANTASPAAAPAASPAGGLDAVVGQQILAVLEQRSLTGSARAEAVRRLALAMQNPTTQNLQSVLDVLLTGEADVGQSR